MLYRLCGDRRGPFKRSRSGRTQAARRQLRVEALEDRTLLNAGLPDPSFGVDGQVTTSFPPGSFSVAQDVAVEPDGKIVVVGSVVETTVSGTGLVRYKADGSLDSTFGTGGVVFVSGMSAVSRIALLPDGKIVTVGVDLARFTANGSLDTTFGNAGLVHLSSPGSDLALQPDGKVVIVGADLQRFRADGSLDTSFGTGGQVPVGAPASGVALQSDGRIVVAAGHLLARFNSDGSPDTTFGMSGKVTPSFTATDVAVQADDRIVAAGSAPDTSLNFQATDFAVGRFNVNGSTDVTFGNNGVATAQLFNGTNAATSVLVQPDDKIVAVGNVVGAAGRTFFGLVRYDPNGTLDASFGSSPGQTLTLGNGANGAALRTDGRIVAVGGQIAGDFFLVQSYTADPPISDANQRFLTQVYLDLLQRQPDAGGLAGFLAGLNAGVSRTQVVSTIENSQEYHLLEVEKLYGLLLDRPADASGLTNWVAFLNQGGTSEQLEALILGSSEYFSRRGGGSNTGYLTALYGDTLQRPVDSVGAQAWGQALASGTSPSAVAAAVLGSLESDMDEVQALFHQLLRRNADPTGLSAFTDALQRGTANEAVLALIAGSDEYFGRL